MKNFSDLSTLKTSKAGMPHVRRLLEQELYPGSQLTLLSDDAGPADPLDSRLGIDGRLHMERSDACLTVQIKIREFEKLVRHGDFTIELWNGDGTRGEFGMISAQLYVYAWLEKGSKSLASWVIVNVPALKLWVETLGGPEFAGLIHDNEKFGKSQFLGIRVQKLIEAGVCATYSLDWAVEQLVA